MPLAPLAAEVLDVPDICLRGLLAWVPVVAPIIVSRVVLNLMLRPEGLFKIKLLTRKLLASYDGSFKKSFGCSLPVIGLLFELLRVVLGYII